MALPYSFGEIFNNCFAKSFQYFVNIAFNFGLQYLGGSGPVGANVKNFTKPHRKKSIGVKSQARGGQIWSTKQESPSGAIYSKVMGYYVTITFALSAYPLPASFQ